MLLMEIDVGPNEFLERRAFKGYMVCIYLSSPGLALNIMSKQGLLSLASLMGCIIQQRNATHT